MKPNAALISLSCTFLVANCATHTTTPFSGIEEIYVIPSVQVEDGDPSFWDIPLLEQPVIATKPVDRNDGLVVGELGVDGGDKEMIVELAQEIAGGEHGDIDSLLITHKGKLVFESYYRRGRVNLTHPQASATKSHTSYVLGRAIQLGYLSMEDLDKPLISLFNDLDRTKFVEGAEKMTLHKALSMRSGIRINDEQKKAFEDNPSQIQGRGLVQTLLEQSAPITEETLTFSYGNYSSHFVMQVIDAAVPGTVDDFIKNDLFGEMGITSYSWQPGMSGLPAGGWRSSITSRAMAKLGTLTMNKGKWNGEQLIPEAYITKATSRIVTTGDDEVFGGGKDISQQGYGYFRWNADMTVGDKTYYSTSAQGGGGQYIILIDALDLMIVVTGHDGSSPTLQLTAERIIPAFLPSD